jgi:hypothetical protein
MKPSLNFRPPKFVAPNLWPTLSIAVGTGFNFCRYFLPIPHPRSANSIRARALFSNVKWNKHFLAKRQHSISDVF